MEKVIQDFQTLVSYDSVSFSERKTADWLIGRLNDMGFEVWEDQAGDVYGGNAGNVFGRLKGELPGKPILLSAHMDVVEPGVGKEAVVRDGVIRSKGDTVLGADDICGILEILYGIEYLQEKGIPHRDVEVLFPIGEEAYIKGTNEFDFSRVTATEAYVLDMSGEVGAAARRAPSILSFQVEIRGRASHAGFAPEKGIHAISLAGLAIGKLNQGYLDEDTTLNIGTISGGVATNIVPESCICTGEIRSYSHERALQILDYVKEVFTTTVERGGGAVSFESEVHLRAYEVPGTAPVVTHFQQACESLGLSGKVGETFGGSDNNNFVNHGLPGLVLSCGMYRVHSVEEYTKINDIKKGIKLVAKLLSQEV